MDKMGMSDERFVGQATPQAESPINLERDVQVLIDEARHTPLVEVRGRVTGVIGIIVRANLPDAWVGELCHIVNPGHDRLLKAEVVGFRGNEALLMPLGDIANIGMQSEIITSGHGLTIKVGPGLLGKVLNGLGESWTPGIDAEWEDYPEYPVMAPPPNALTRPRVLKPLSVGIRAIDGLLTCGEGQRIGLFAAAGVGKSTVMGMIARNTEAEINVIALIGERGREVNDFIEESLGSAIDRSVLVVATSDEPALVRLKAAYVATTIASYFRDQGKRVMLLMDSVTRFARAQREVGLAAGELPARGGFPPSVFSVLPRLLERAGNSEKGSITAFYTVLVEGDDMTEPVADEVRSILDGHVVLSRRLANERHYPAIDVLQSVSRVMSAVATPEHRKHAELVTRLYSTYEQNKEAIEYNIYKKGSNANTLIEQSISKRESILEFLRQGVNERVSFEESLLTLAQVAEGH